MWSRQPTYHFCLQGEKALSASAGFLFGPDDGSGVFLHSITTQKAALLISPNIQYSNETCRTCPNLIVAQLQQREVLQVAQILNAGDPVRTEEQLLQLV
jgi:hypothetical protein